MTIHRWVYNRQHAGVCTHLVNLQVRGYAQGDKTSSCPSIAGPELCGETHVKSKNSLINLQESWAVPSAIVQKQSTQFRTHSGYCLRKRRRRARSSRSILMQVECSDYEPRHSDCNIILLLLKASLIITGAVTQIAPFRGEKTLQRTSEAVEFTKIIALDTIILPTYFTCLFN